jgi:hypothetical protein
MKTNKYRWLLLFLILAWSTALFAPDTAQAQGPQPRGMGLIPSSPAQYRPALPPGLKIGYKLPVVVDNAALGMPPVGDQGSQDSCVAWATTYYYKTFQEKQEQGWDVTVADHQFSPAMTYNMRTAFTPDPCTVDDGMRFPDALDILANQGALPLSAFPYDPIDPCTQPTAVQLADAYPYRSLGYGAFFVYGEGGHVTDGQLEVLKAHLADGNVLLIGIPVYAPSFWHPEDNDDVVDVPGEGEEERGFHAIAVVGYDDQAAGGAGAFKFVNSWGPTYAGDGYAYLTYDFVKGYAYEAWWMVDRLAPKGCVEGTVLDAASQPVADVTIAIDGPTPWTGTTDENGHFASGSVLDYGTYTVTLSKAGYTFSPVSAEVQVTGETCITLAFTASQVSEAVVYIEPASQILSCGEVVTFAVAVRDIIDFYGVQFQLTFDPAVIEVVDPDGDPANGILVPGDIFPANEYHVGDEVVDNTSGQIEYAITLLREPKAPPFTGSGTLAVVLVRGLAEGVSPLVFASVQTVNKDGDPIPSSTEDGVLTVECLTTLSGHAYLEARTDHSGITVTLEGTGLTVLTGVDGAYTFADVPSGTYTVTFAHQDFLTTEVGEVTVLENEENELCGYVLLAGDMNNDGAVDILDLTLCASHFETTAPEADVNADGIVNIYDLVLVGKNFKLTSPQPGACVP